MAIAYLEDATFQDALLSLLVRDLETLKTCSSLITGKDFRPKGKSSPLGQARWLTSIAALAHFEKYRKPIGKLIVSELRQSCINAGIEGDRLKEILAYGRKISRKKVQAPESITDKVVAFKKELLKANCVDEMINLQARGELTDEKWLELSRAAIELLSPNKYRSVDYFEELSDRIDRRRFQKEDRFPQLLIPEFDVHMRAIARGHLGLILAPYKRGKSLALIHITRAYVLQGLNVLYITLEDPKDDVEDRFDAGVTALPIKNLSMRPRLLKKRFERFKKFIKARLKIVDGTDQSVTVATIDSWIEEERNNGFLVDAVVIDYDDEMAASKKNQDRRLEFAEIYRDMRKLASRRNVLVWTAAQTQRNTQDLRVISGDKLAEDVSKVRKVSLALALGQGDWGEDSIYLHVAAHKFDKQFFGCNIMSNKERMLFYDLERTAKARKHPEKYKPKEEDYDG